MMKNLNPNYTSLLRSIKVDINVPEVVLDSPLDDPGGWALAKNISGWLDDQDIDLFPSPTPGYYFELQRWLKHVDQSIITQGVDVATIYYDESIWKHPWLGVRMGAGKLTYHHFLLSFFNFLCCNVCKLDFKNPIHLDRAYNLLLTLSPPETHFALFVELRARIAHGAIHKHPNTMLDAPYRMIPEPTLIPVEFI